MRERTRVERSASETEGLEDRSGRNDGDVFARCICTRSRVPEYPNARSDAEKDCGSDSRKRGMTGNVLQYRTDAPTTTSIRISLDERMHVYVHFRDSDAIANACGRVLLMVCAVLPDFHRDIRVGNQHAAQSHCFYIFRPYFIFKCPWRIFCRSRSYVLNASALRKNAERFFSGHTRVI